MPCKETPVIKIQRGEVPVRRTLDSVITDIGDIQNRLVPCLVCEISKLVPLTGLLFGFVFTFLTLLYLFLVF